MDAQEIATIFALGLLAHNPESTYAEVVASADKLADAADLDAPRFRAMVVCAALQNSEALQCLSCSRRDS